MNLFKKTLLITLTITLVASMLMLLIKNKTTLEIETPDNSTEHYVGTVSLSNHTSIRIIVLKHCRERVADSESTGVLQAANFAATKGLKITDLGQHHVDRDGELKVAWGEKLTLNGLKDFINEQMKVSAKNGDTLVIYTTGHGNKNGSVQILGRRDAIARIFAEAAEENNQETLWWQSSCFAEAGLPKISTLNNKQQSLFSMIASSDKTRSSYWHDQTEPMKKVFLAIANQSKELDQDQNDIVSGGELRQYLKKYAPRVILFVKDEQEAIFGWFDLANSLPIIDRNGEKLPENHIPLPTL